MGRMRQLSAEEKRAEKQRLVEDVAAGSVEIPDAIRRMRAITGLSQSEFASRIAGISTAALARIESGAGNPRLDTLTKIGRAFGLAPRFVRVRGKG